MKIQEVYDTLCPCTFFTFISDCHPHITQEQVGLRIRKHYQKIQEQLKDYLHFTCANSRYPTCCNTAYQDPTNEEAGYLSSNISDVSPIIEPPPRPTPRGPNRLA